MRAASSLHWTGGALCLQTQLQGPNNSVTVTLVGAMAAAVVAEKRQEEAVGEEEEGGAVEDPLEKWKRMHAAPPSAPRADRRRRRGHRPNAKHDWRRL